jgi:hypothetical protein
VTDETQKPPTGEPEPGSTEWLLAQLSGGRIDSRRERREAEAALEAAGVQLPDAPAEHLVTETAAPETDATDAAADEKPRARFSWETGTLQAVGDDQAEPAPDAFATPGAAPTPQDEAAPLIAPEVPGIPPVPAVPAATSEPSAPTPAEQTASADWQTIGESAPARDAEGAIPFMWNLSPTQEPDPAVNPRAELPEPAPAEPQFRVASAAPLVVPKPLAPEAPAEAVPTAPEAPTAPAAPVEAAAAPQPPTDEPFFPPVPAAPLDEPQLPQPPAAPFAAAQAESPVAPTESPAAPAAPGRPPLPPGTTAHEFDPFAQDLFAPRPAASTPVPSVDEFTIPDEGSSAEASVPASVQASETPHPAEEQQPAEVTSDWSDIADMLGAHPETVDNAIVSPMPPVNEILPSFDAVLPRSAPAAPSVTAPPPERPANAPIEHVRGGSSLNRWLLIAAAVLLAILIAVALFTLGRSFAAGHDQAPAAATRTTTPSPTATTASATPTPTPTASEDQTVAGTGPLAPGQTYRWDQLRGGECLSPFTSAWAQQFAVVDCNAQHAAQLVYSAPFAADPAAPFPGEQAITSQVNLLCSKPGVIDLHAASAYSDVQVVAAYPVTAEQWDSGQRNYFCFVNRASGQPFTSSVAGPGPTE